MPGVYYSSGGKLISNTINGRTPQDLMDAIKQSLVSAGWHYEGPLASAFNTTGYQLKSLATPKGHSCNFYIYWDGSTNQNGAILTAEGADGHGNSRAKFGQITAVDGAIFRIIAGPHQFFTFADGQTPSTYSPFIFCCLMGGVPVTFGDNPAFWFLGRTQVGNANDGFRYTCAPVVNYSGYNFLINGVSPVFSTSDITPELLVMRGSQLTGVFAFKNHNYPVQTPTMIYGIKPNLYVVSLWDAIVSSIPFAEKRTFNADDHSWEVYTIGTDVGALILATGEAASIGFGQGFTY